MLYQFNIKQYAVIRNAVIRNVIPAKAGIHFSLLHIRTQFILNVIFSESIIYHLSKNSTMCLTVELH